MHHLAGDLSEQMSLIEDGCLVKVEAKLFFARFPLFLKSDTDLKHF